MPLIKSEDIKLNSLHSNRGTLEGRYKLLLEKKNYFDEIFQAV